MLILNFQTDTPPLLPALEHKKFNFMKNKDELIMCSNLQKDLYNFQEDK